MSRRLLSYGCFLGLVLLVGCGRESSLSGDFAQVEVVSDPSVFPSVAIVISPGGASMCTGTFISPRAVLTAAHCARLSGTYRILSSFGTFSTARYQTLGSATVSDTSDMAILILDEPVALRRESQVSPVASLARPGEQVRLVGFGCDNLDTRSGSGVKRTGVNVVFSVSDFIELYTPFEYSASSTPRSILGPYGQAGTCFGDSGGPLFRMTGEDLSIVGICHAGGHDSETIVSQFINLNRPENINFIRSVNARYDLGIFDVCDRDDPMPIPECGSSNAAIQIVSFLKSVWTWVKSLWSWLPF